MEARTAFRGTGISKSMATAVVAVLLALLLVAVGWNAAKALRTPIALATTHVVAGQPGATWSYGNGRHGTSWIEGPAAVGAAISGSFHEPGTRRGGTQIAP
jgi:hypothetical protein